MRDEAMDGTTTHREDAKRVSSVLEVKRRMRDG
jgi:hypothetical protein